MTRIRFVQADSWNRPQDGRWCGDPYADNRCCFCFRPTKPSAARLMLSRTNDGEWWLVDRTEPVQDDESDFGRFTLPIGPDCLKRHPEWRFAVVGV